MSQLPSLSPVQRGLVAVAAALVSLFLLVQAVACNVPGGERVCALATEAVSVSENVGGAVDGVDLSGGDEEPSP